MIGVPSYTALPIAELPTDVVPAVKAEQRQISQSLRSGVHDETRRLLSWLKVFYNIARKTELCSTTVPLADPVQHAAHSLFMAVTAFYVGGKSPMPCEVVTTLRELHCLSRGIYVTRRDDTEVRQGTLVHPTLVLRDAWCLFGGAKESEWPEEGATSPNVTVALSEVQSVLAQHRTFL